MARQRKRATPANKAIHVEGLPGDNVETAYARALLRPSVQAAATFYEFEKLESANTDINALIGELGKQVEAVHKGDYERMESMLLIQAHTLDELFNNLTRRAGRAEYMDTLDRYMRLALKAQSQCRATLETLATVRNPVPAMFVRQQNFGMNQQVNNDQGKHPRAREKEKPQNELLEAKDGERLDFRASDTTSRVDPAMATVGKLDGAANGEGQGTD
jgi:hypothetical protein